MSLIKCPECEKEISDKSTVCIHCGFPLSREKETTETDDRYQIVLLNCTNKIDTIKLVMELKGVSLANGKDLIDSCPSVILENLSVDEAEKIKARFESLGSNIKIVKNVDTLKDETDLSKINETDINNSKEKQSSSVNTINKTNKNNIGCGTIIAIIFAILMLISVFTNEDDSTSKYSSDYYNNKSYRDNVNDIADIYGEDAEAVDRMIQAIEDEMNK